MKHITQKDVDNLESEFLMQEVKKTDIVRNKFFDDLNEFLDHNDKSNDSNFAFLRGLVLELHGQIFPHDIYTDYLYTRTGNIGL